jgi:hypothetical protein
LYFCEPSKLKHAKVFEKVEATTSRDLTQKFAKFIPQTAIHMILIDGRFLHQFLSATIPEFRGQGYGRGVRGLKVSPPPL